MRWGGLWSALPQRWRHAVNIQEPVGDIPPLLGDKIKDPRISLPLIHSFEPTPIATIYPVTVATPGPIPARTPARIPHPRAFHRHARSSQLLALGAQYYRSHAQRR